MNSCLLRIELFFHILQTSICASKQVDLLLIFVGDTNITVLENKHMTLHILYEVKFKKMHSQIASK